MKKYKSNKTLNGLLIFLIPTIIVIIYLLYIKQDVPLSDNWISIEKVNQISNIQSVDTSNYYCNSYSNIRNEKNTLILLILILVCLITILISLIVFLLRKLNVEKEKNKIYFKEKNKEQKNNIIISRFENNEVEIKLQQLLGDEFKNIIYSVFCNLQMACMNFDYNMLKNLLTDELYNNYCTSLDVLKSKARRNIFSDFEFVSAKFVDIIENEELSSIKVHLKVKFYGYIIDTNTNEIIKGSKEEKITETYMLKLVKYKNKSNNWIISEKEKITEN